MPKKPAKKKAPKRKTAARPKRQPKEDFNQMVFRTIQARWAKVRKGKEQSEQVSESPDQPPNMLKKQDDENGRRLR